VTDQQHSRHQHLQHPHQKSANCPKGSLLEQVAEENPGGTGQPRFTWKTAIQTMALATVKRLLSRSRRHKPDGWQFSQLRSASVVQL